MMSTNTFHVNFHCIVIGYFGRRCSDCRCCRNGCRSGWKRRHGRRCHYLLCTHTKDKENGNKKNQNNCHCKKALFDPAFMPLKKLLSLKICHNRFHLIPIKIPLLYSFFGACQAIRFLTLASFDSTYCKDLHSTAKYAIIANRLEPVYGQILFFQTIFQM